MVQNLFKKFGSEFANDMAIVSLNDNRIADAENNFGLFEIVKKIWQTINNVNG